MKTRAEQILPYVQGETVLDVGCTGHQLEPDSPHWLHGQLVGHFPSVFGIDLNTENVEKLSALGYKNVEVGNAETFALDRTFDTIVAGELIEHLSNPGLFLDRVREHLSPGGRAVITTPYPFSLLFWLYAFLKYPVTCQNPEHTAWFCPETFRELSSRAGLRIVEWKLVEDYRPDDPSRPYRIFVKLLTWFGWLLPARLRCNTMLFVLEKAGAA